MQDITLEQLLASGAHFGHKTSRWNPKMAPYIFTVRNKFHIIDLEKTHEKLVAAQAFAADIVRGGGTVLFVGTKRQAQKVVREQALACGSPYVTTRWLGGTLTNFKTIQRSIRKLTQLEELLSGLGVAKYTKKERLMFERERAKNTILFEGIRTLKKIPEALFAIDTNSDSIAVKEARLMGVRVIAIVDTNSDPGLVDYPIPANDDAIKSVSLITQAVSEAIAEARTATPAPEVKSE
ncbi:MAG: 30S ribosomal protein S2 [Candidatus Doudnabacteria bacterium RIFCSPHIGHO2_01_FULL_50_11]|uniref:Small ribosomal subunit protein uS2 n=1 Tax=Candidatus Doudnabacteria bacterium RIFCSPHIGHO2_01_FULL_50_11 TaxID=1817828 RepID=A0A1F5PFN5_9BACT|nr:MAG: 30S ribosomal protein S2 [Candidatus Doudnabacteria bacterium RIFCSPHIGHO2_01_FULL_50_11]HLC44419.1 30S ribosomal protein S2 [Patescibacteria group bacterium]